MDGLVRSVGAGIGFFVGGAWNAVGTAIHTVFAQIERVVPGGALPAVVVGLFVLLLVWMIARR